MAGQVTNAMGSDRADTIEKNYECPHEANAMLLGQCEVQVTAVENQQ